MVYLDLFSGVGGFAKGFVDAGVHITKHYFSEIDKHAIAVYKYNFKDAEYAGDIRAIQHLYPKPNIITFGFPCQDLSVVGRRKGLSGQRSGLFFEAIRIIEKFRPEVFIFENVKGLLSSNNGKDFEIVLRTIADIGIYECEWQLVNTAWILPQNRERIYFVGHLGGLSRPRVFPFRKSDPEFNQQHQHNSESEIASCLQSPGNACGNYKGMNAVISNSGVGRKFEFRENTIPPLRVNTGMGNNDYVCIPVLTPDRHEKRQNGRRVKEDGEPAFTLNTQDIHGVMITDELYKDRRREYKNNSPTLKHDNSRLKVETTTQILKCARSRISEHNRELASAGLANPIIVSAMEGLKNKTDITTNDQAIQFIGKVEIIGAK